MTNKFLLATNNQNKIEEISNIFSDTDITIVSMKDESIYIEPEETGNTFAENAIIKAKEISKYTPYPVIADDSGLVVDCLNGEPGVRSKRYSGEKASDSENNDLLLKNLKGFAYEERTAHFICNIALVLPDGKSFIVEGRCSGHITLHPAGDNGFGYDPVFYIPELNKTFAQLTMEEKNKISHRAKALKKLHDILKKE